jgi:hypothetical protein
VSAVGLLSGLQMRLLIPFRNAIQTQPYRPASGHIRFQRLPRHFGPRCTRTSTWLLGTTLMRTLWVCSILTFTRCDQGSLIASPLVGGYEFLMEHCKLHPVLSRQGVKQSDLSFPSLRLRRGQNMPFWVFARRIHRSSSGGHDP